MEFSFYDESIFVHNPRIDDSLYARFIPAQSEDKAISSATWYKGCCIKHGDITIALLGEWCYYDDKFTNLFVEYDVCFYVLVVYSAKGEILDHKTICYRGGGSYGTTYFARITPTGNPLTFRVEQATLDGDGMLIASPEPIWITSSIDAGESKYVSAVAPSAKARDFRLKLLGNVRGY